MSLALTPPPPSPPTICYPESDGNPLADNPKQLRWIVVLFGNLCALFRDRTDVFVAGNLLWYPVEGQPEVRIAPDVLVVFGRPKGDRGSYKQWEEGGIPLTVVFEILSPNNTLLEMTDKLSFYEDHGVEEYYVYDPDQNHLVVYQRQGTVLRRVRPVHGFVSPRLGIRFDVAGSELVVRYPDGRPFQTFEELTVVREQAELSAAQASQRAEQANQRAEQASQRAEQAVQRANRLAELSRKARRGQATAAELEELDHLEEPPQPPSA